MPEEKNKADNNWFSVVFKVTAKPEAKGKNPRRKRKSAVKSNKVMKKTDLYKRQEEKSDNRYG